MLIMKRFKELICQYPTTFLFPGSSLGAVKGFQHRTDTVNAPRICSRPNKKRPQNSKRSKQKSSGRFSSR